MIRQAFIIDSATGAAVQRVKAPTLDVLYQHPLQAGQAFLLYDGGGDIDQLLPQQSGYGFDFVAAEPDAELLLLQAKLDKWSEIKARRDREFKITPTQFGIFDTDDRSEANIAGKIQWIDKMLERGEPVPDTIMWKLHDNNFVPMTRDQLEEVGLLIVPHREEVYATSWQLEAAINAATTLDDVAAIAWP